MFAFRFLVGRRMPRHLTPPGKVGSHRETWQRHETLCKRAARRQPRQRKLDWWWSEGFELFYQTALCQAGVGNRTLHSTRHTFVSVARSSGVDPKVVDATCIVVDFTAARKQRFRCGIRDPPNPQRALEWLRQLEAGEIASRAAIARREGLSRARVTQILKRLDATVARRQRAG